MIIPIILLCLIDASSFQNSQLISDNLSLKEIKGSRSLINESAVLSNIDDQDPFCKENANDIFPDPYARNIYYRCQGERRETWKCIGDSYFDHGSQSCTQSKTSVREPSPINVFCFGQEDGLYPLYSTNCKYYVRCKAGMATEVRQCPPNESFSFKLQGCRFTSEVACIRPICAHNSDDFFIIPGSKCQAYYYCRRGKRSDFLCPKGQIFNLNKKKCTDGGICYEPICTGRMNGIYMDTTHACNRYFRCSGGEMQEVTSCPKSLKHNGHICTFASQVKCEPPEKTAAAYYNPLDDDCKGISDGISIVPDTNCTKIRTCIGGRTINTRECPNNYSYNGYQCLHRELTQCDKYCSGRRDGFYPDRSKKCQEYYSCYNGKMKERRKCDNGFLFNGKTCISSSLAQCPEKTNKTSCIGLPNGFHPDYFSGCRDYYFCHNQQIILKETCPLEMRWNGSHCVQKNQVQCYGPSLLSQCSDVVPGLYQDLLSKCKYYIYCNSGMGTILSCSNGKIFDGTKCKNVNEYTCPSDIYDECYNQPDGYKQDIYSGCHSYFFCSRGRKITYICQNNMIFNGTHCVSPKLYTCPYDFNDCEGKYNGYYPDEASGCRKYFFCLNGKRITTINCEGKKIFNGEACIVVVGDVKAACSKATHNPCHHRRDGKYFHRMLQCHKNIKCENQVLTEETLFPQGIYFNGFNCSSNISNPTKHEKNICSNHKMGFIQDYASGCKNYHFCIGNLRMSAVCPTGTIFNGKVCQDSRTYKCPSDSEIN